MKPDFEIAFKRTVANEGGYVNDPTDKGGETYMGISRKNFPNWDGWVLIDKESNKANLKTNVDLTNRVEAFYKRTFWDVMMLDYIEDQNIANEMFDTGVNMGTGTAVKFLQESLNLLNRNQKDYADIVVDGQLGQGTVATFAKCGNKIGLLKCLNGLQFERYKDICQRDPTQKKYMNGWLNRI